jgi:isocitrate/isopropylmalate dehydrogenase
MTITHEIALIPGDGVGPQILPAGVAVLETGSAPRDPDGSAGPGGVVG